MASTKQMQERAKARKKASEQLQKVACLQPVAMEVASIIKREWLDAGKPIGACAAVTIRAMHLLKERGYDATFVKGWAGFSLTTNHLDAIVWDPRAKKSSTTGGEQAHAWLQIDDVFLDFSPVSFNEYMLYLERMDGIKAGGTWKQDYHLVHTKDAMTHFQSFVRAKLQPGILYYQSMHYPNTDISGDQHLRDVLDAVQMQ